MRKIAIINQKGGSGKTTTAVNLAATLAEKKRSVLLIDLDPQASATTWLSILENEEKGLLDVFTMNASLKSIIINTAIGGVDMVRSSSWLIGLEKALAREVGAESILKNKLGELQGLYDYVIIDCPPTLGILTVNALTAVEEVIVPVEARVMALGGLVQLLETIDVIKKRLNPNLRVSGILPCRVDLRTNHAKEVVETIKKQFKDLAFKTSIRENIRLAEAPSFTVPITDYDEWCNGSCDYRALAKEVIRQEKSIR